MITDDISKCQYSTELTASDRDNEALCDPDDKSQLTAGNKESVHVSLKVESQLNASDEIDPYENGLYPDARVGDLVSDKTVEIEEINVVENGAIVTNEVVEKPVMKDIKTVNENVEMVSNAVVKFDNTKVNYKKMQQMFSILNTQHDADQRVQFLYAIIYKLKERGIVLRNDLDCNDQSQPALSESVNTMTRKVIEKQMEVDSAKKECKELKLQVKDLKEVKTGNEKEMVRLNSEKASLEKMISSMKVEYAELQKEIKELNENEAIKELEKLKRTHDELTERISELHQESLMKDEKMIEVEKSNAELISRCKSLTTCERDLSARVKMLEGLSAHIGKPGDGNSDVVVINSTGSNSDNAEEFRLLNDKLDKANKENSLLKDQLSEKTASLEKIDHFYKEIIDQKDQSVNEYLKVINGGEHLGLSKNLDSSLT